MKTFNRIPNQINTSVSSYNKSVKYYNQLEWKGLVENKNIYDVDQNSQADAKNVYVDDHGSLASRPPLLGEKLPIEVLPEGNTLVEVKQYSGITVYVSKDDENKYTIVATKRNRYEVLPLKPTSYHLSNIDNFIICFNNLGAKVIDMNNVGRGWFLLQEIVDNTPFPHDGELYENRFSTLTRKSYTFTPEGITPSLPTDYNIDEGIDMTIKTEDNQSTNWHFSIIDNKLPNFDQLENLAFKQIAMSESFDNGDYDIAIGQENIICIYKHGERKIRVSRDNGATFVDKGFDSHDEMQNAKLMAISDDGIYCFIITPLAVYVLSLAEDLAISSWDRIRPWGPDSTYQLQGSGIFDIVYGYYHFVTKDTFAFITTDGKLWFMGPHLAGVPNADYGSDERRNGLNADRIGKLGCCNIPTSLYTRLNLNSSKPNFYTDYGSNDLRAYFKNVNDRGLQIKSYTGNLVQNAPAPTTTQENQNWYINANRGGNYTQVENCTTIVINSFTGVNSQNNTGQFGVMTTIILPATQCTLFNNGRVAPLDFHNKYYGGGLNSREENPGVNYEFYKIPRDFTIIASLGNTLDANDTWNFESSTIDPLERTVFDLKTLLRNKDNSIGAINVTGTSNDTGLYSWENNGYSDFINSTYFTDNANYSNNLSSKDHQPMAIRINSVNILNDWTIPTYTVTNNLVNDLGVWQIKGYMCLDRRRNLSSLTNNHEYVWITFTYEIAIYFGDTTRGYNSVNKPRLSYICFDKKLDLNIPIETSIDNWSRSKVALTAPYQITDNTLFDTRSNFTIKEDTSGWYTDYHYIIDKILKMPDELWADFNTINNTIFTDTTNLLIEIISIKNDIIYFKYNNKLYTNKLNSTDIGALIFTWRSKNDNYTEVPNLSFEMNSELYLGFGNTLSITANTKSENANTRGEIRLYLPFINDNKFINTISNIINISTTEVAIFFENKIYICKQVEDNNIKFGYRYDYIPTKLSTGTRVGDSVINNIEGTYTIFPTRRGLAVMNYQAFMSTTDQALEYITHDIEDRYEKFYFESNKINIVQHRDYLVLANGTGHLLIYNLYKQQWWYWEVPENIKIMSTDQVNLKLISNKLCVFKEHERYQDFALTPNAKRIEWFIQSQPLHMKAPNYYKNLKQLVFQLLDEGQADKKHSITVQVQCYRKKLDTKVPELINFTIDELRTFVKRFNYWKINEIQYGLADDPETLTPTRLRLNGVSIKYEIGEEVR